MAEMIPVAAAELDELRRDKARLDRLDLMCEAVSYTGEDHDANRWQVEGPHSSIRDAIDGMPPYAPPASSVPIALNGDDDCPF
jgi:hypothetical protein